MAKYNIPASVMADLERDHCGTYLNIDTAKYRFGSNTQIGQLRFAVPYLCLIQVGYLLTKHSSKNFTHAQDGTPVDTTRGRHHVETFVITVGDLTIKALPWVQTDKKGATSARGFRDMVSRSQSAYLTFYQYCVRLGVEGDLPQPRPIGSILSSIKVGVPHPHPTCIVNPNPNPNPNPNHQGGDL